MISLSARRCPATALPTAIMTRADLDALGTVPAQQMDDGRSEWWREGRTIVRWTGRWSPYGNEVEVRAAVVT